MRRPTSRTRPSHVRTAVGGSTVGTAPRAVSRTRNFDLPLLRFTKEFLSESFDLDARLRQTIGPLFLRPGHVAAEYVAGHRAKFVPPIRMYVLASFVLFLVLSMTANSKVVINTENGESVESVGQAGGQDPDGAAREDPGPGGTSATDREDPETGTLRRFPIPDALGDSLRTRLSRGVTEAAADPDAFTDLFLNRLAQGMFLLLPAFALLLKVLWRDHLYVHHLIFSVNFHTVVFFVIALGEVIAAVPGKIPEYVGATVMLAVPAHLILGIRRFYGSGWTGTLIKSLLLGVSYLAVLIVTLMGLLLLSVLFL